MKVTFLSNGKVLLDDCRIIYRNFEGRGDKFNHEGDRNFKVVVDDQEIADALVEHGCNLKIKEPSEPGEIPFMFFEVKISYKFYDPVVYLKSGKAMNSLEEQELRQLDVVDIERVDMDIHFGKEWTQNGITARTAYLDKIVVVQEIDRFMERYAENEYPGE